MGDVVLTEPVTAILREAYPHASIGFAVKRAYVDVVASNPSITRLHVLDDGSTRGLQALCREVRPFRYDTVIDLHRNARSATLGRCTGASRSLRYRKRELRDALRVRLLRKPFRASKRLVERYIEALGPLSIDAPYRRPRFHLSDIDRAWADGYLRAKGIERGSFATMVPGSVWATKRWPGERYADLATRVASQLGLPVLVLGSPAESDLSAGIADQGGSGVVAAAGDTTLGRMAALIAAARIYVGNDSGPTHIAMALDVPSVALFGPTDPGQFDFEGHRLLYADLPCSACSFFGGERCRLTHWNCMTSIAVDEAFGAVRDLLEDRGRPRALNREPVSAVKGRR